MEGTRGEFHAFAIKYKTSFLSGLPATTSNRVVTYYKNPDKLKLFLDVVQPYSILIKPAQQTQPEKMPISIDPKTPLTKV